MIDPSRGPASQGGFTGLVFDLDGTLVNTAADIARAVNALLAGYGIPPQSTAYVEQFIGEGARELIAGVYRGLGIEVSAERLDADTTTYIGHYRKAPVVDSAPYHDALPALAALRKAGVQLGVCTNKTQAMAEAVLEQLGLARYMDVIVGGDALPVRKPDPRHLLATLERMGLEASRTLYVGDTPIDVQCARAAGVECVLVEWAAPVDGPNPPGRISRFSELLDLVAPAAATG